MLYYGVISLTPPSQSSLVYRWIPKVSLQVPFLSCILGLNNLLSLGYRKDLCNPKTLKIKNKYFLLLFSQLMHSLPWLRHHLSCPFLSTLSYPSRTYFCKIPFLYPLLSIVSANDQNQPASPPSLTKAPDILLISLHPSCPFPLPLKTSDSLTPRSDETSPLLRSLQWQSVPNHLYIFTSHHLFPMTFTPATWSNSHFFKRDTHWSQACTACLLLFALHEALSLCPRRVVPITCLCVSFSRFSVGMNCSPLYSKSI